MLARSGSRAHCTCFFALVCLSLSLLQSYQGSTTVNNAVIMAAFGCYALSKTSRGQTSRFTWTIRSWATIKSCRKVNRPKSGPRRAMHRSASHLPLSSLLFVGFHPFLSTKRIFSTSYRLCAACAPSFTQFLRKSVLSPCACVQRCNWSA